MGSIENQSTISKEQQDFPSVDLAYSFALSSYESALKRIESLDNRLQALLTVGVTVSLPILPIASSKNISFHSVWFYLAATAFILATIAGFIGRLWGKVILMHPSTFYHKWLHFSEWEFKKNFVYFAGEHFEANRKLSDRRSLFTNLSGLLFLLEAALVVVWLSVRHS